MKPLQLVIDGQSGYVFEGVAEGTVAFVPEDCVVSDEPHRLDLDEARYLRSGWAEKNMRFASQAEGERLWPRSERPIERLEDARVQALLARLRNAYDVEPVGAST